MPSHAAAKLLAEDSFPYVTVDTIAIVRARVWNLVRPIRVVFLVVLHLELR